MHITKDSSLDEVWKTGWDYLMRAAVDKGHPMRYLTLATGRTGESGLRMIVLREIGEQNSLVLYTDARSAKVEQVKGHSHATILTYHPRHKVQIRLSGTMALHIQDPIADEYWKRVQGPPRKAYTSLLAPGTPIDNPEEAHKWPEELDSKYFCVLVFTPQEMEVLQLNQLAHIRAVFEIEGVGWKGSWMVP